MTFTGLGQGVLETGAACDDSRWPGFRQMEEVRRVKKDTSIVVRGYFELPPFSDGMRVTLFTKSISENQSVFVNGHLIAASIRRGSMDQNFVLDKRILVAGRNSFAVSGVPFVMTQQWENLNADPGAVQVYTQAGLWKRRAFNGFAQLIVQSKGRAGEIALTASSFGLKPGTIRIKTVQAEIRPSVPEN
jgi:beta-galactosidase